MEKGFGEGSPGFRVSDLARKVINVDGKMLGKDGKPLIARRNIIQHTDVGIKDYTGGSESHKDPAAGIDVKTVTAAGNEGSDAPNTSIAAGGSSSSGTNDKKGIDGSAIAKEDVLGMYESSKTDASASAKGVNEGVKPSFASMVMNEVHETPMGETSKPTVEAVKSSFSASGIEKKGNDDSASAKEDVHEVHETTKSEVNEPATVGTVKASIEATNSGTQTISEKLKPSFASIVNTEKPKAKVNFRKVETKAGPKGDFEAMIPVSSVKEVNDRLNNSIYGYFIGKRLAFPVVENYVRNSWGKYGIQKVMMNAKGIYFFKFASSKGVDDVLENGPWMIRTIPIILNKWSPTACLSKENHETVPVWVKMHDVPLAAFTADGLSVIASKVGSPIMMDAYTSTMCEESWGRSSYARVMIEINAKDTLKEDVVIAVPNIEDDGYVCAKIKIEYEWRPPQCGECKIFGHECEACPKVQVTKESGKPNANLNGFQQVKPKPFRGLVVGNQKKVSVGKTKKVYVPKIQNKEAGKTSTSNSFEALNKIDPNVDNSASASKKLDEQVEDKQAEDRGKKVESSSTGFFKSASLYEKWKQTDGYEDDDSDDVLDAYDYDMTDYLDSQERQGRRKS